MSQRIKDFIGTSLDFLTFFITGATPQAVNAKIDSILNELSVALVKKLCNVSLIAAASNRASVENYITRADNADLSRLIRDHYYIQDHTNFSHLNLLGHMLLAGGTISRRDFIVEFRNKMGANSIWECNFNRCNLSDAQKKILSEKVRRLPGDAVMVMSKELVQKLAAKIARNKGPADNTSNVPPSVPPFVPRTSTAGIRINEPTMPMSHDNVERADTEQVVQEEPINENVSREEVQTERQPDTEADTELLRRAENAAKMAADAAKLMEAEARLRAQEANEQAQRDKEEADAVARERAEAGRGQFGQEGTETTDDPLNREPIFAVPLNVVTPEDETMHEFADDPNVENVDETIAEPSKDAASGKEDDKAKSKKERKTKATEAVRKSARKAAKPAGETDDSPDDPTVDAAAAKRKRKSEGRDDASKVQKSTGGWK